VIYCAFALFILGIAASYNYARIHGAVVVAFTDASVAPVREQSIYFPLHPKGELAEMISSGGSRMGALYKFHPDAVVDAIKADDLSDERAYTDFVLLLNYLIAFAALPLSIILIAQRAVRMR
jgi:acyl CoA:acetate/3-ketoacid CoA transferase alpha subunit